MPSGTIEGFVGIPVATVRPQTDRVAYSIRRPKGSFGVDATNRQDGAQMTLLQTAQFAIGVTRGRHPDSCTFKNLYIGIERGATRQPKKL